MSAVYSKPYKCKKHKKIKTVDPFYTGKGRRKSDEKNARKETGIRRAFDQIEADAEKPSRRFLELFEYPNDSSAADQKRKKKQKTASKRKKSKFEDVMEPGMTRPLRQVPKFVQGKRETKKSFLMRVERETQRVLNRSKFEQKYKVQFDDSKPGEIVISEQQPKKKSENKKEHDKLKSAKRKLTRLNRKEKRLGDFHHLQDVVRFGDVVTQPPQLTAKPRKAVQTFDKPGKRPLLLKEILGQNRAQSHNVPSLQHREIGKTLKRRLLPHAEKRKIDVERERVVQAYRDMKKSKMQNIADHDSRTKS